MNGAKLFGAAENDYQSVHLAAVMLEATQFDAFNGHRAIYNEHGNAPYIALARSALGDTAFEAAFSDGNTLSFETLHILVIGVLM